jgi:hypothetical protein
MQPVGEHLWVFHIAGGNYADQVQLIWMGDQTDAKGQRTFRTLASRTWDGRYANDLAGFRATPVDVRGLSWSLRSPSGETSWLSYTLAGDTAIGTLTLANGTRYPTFGVRFDSASAKLIAPTLPPTSYDPQPVVMIRIDDVPATDRDFLQRLKMRGLTAEIAVPTRFVGLVNRLTWQDLRYWRAEGMGVAMHSRYHRSSSASAQDFVGEVVGGFSEMAAHGFPTNVFVQPGTWRDSIYFDSPAKLRTWRGALLRTFATVSECYAYPYWVSRADTLALGLSHVTISDGASDALVRAWWRAALRPNHATVVLVHTAHLKTPDQLDWFLDLVADAKGWAIVRVVGNSQELFSSSKRDHEGEGVKPERH